MDVTDEDKSDDDDDGGGDGDGDGIIEIDVGIDVDVAGGIEISGGACVFRKRVSCLKGPTPTCLVAANKTIQRSCCRDLCCTRVAVNVSAISK